MFIKKIVIAIDESPLSTKVLEYGISLAEYKSAEVAIVSIVDNSNIMGEGNITPSEIVEYDEKKANDFLANVLQKFQDKTITKFVVTGSPIYKEILTVSDKFGADIIVIGTHGRTGISHFIMGSVSEDLIKHSNKPVLVIPNKLDNK